MSAAAYPLAAIPEPFYVLGVRLKPFCLGHYLLMERFGIAFVSSEEKAPSLLDLVFGVMICSMSYEGFLRFLEEEELEKQIFEWGKQCKDFDWVAKATLFNRYIIEGSRRPVVIYEADGQGSNAHWAQTLKLTLTGQLGYTASQALNLPLHQAFADFYRHAETLGVVTIADEATAAALALQEQEMGVAHGN